MKPIPVSDIKVLSPVPADMQRALDRAMADVFARENSAFMSSLMCGMEVCFSYDMPTAGTDGLTIWINPDLFMSLPRESRLSLLVHEINHPARLHNIRCGNRDLGDWNDAADYVINANMAKDGFTFVGLEFGMHDMQFVDMSEEEVYDLIHQGKGPQPPVGGGGQSHRDLIIDPETAQKVAVKVIANVNKAAMAADLAGQPGTIPGEVRSTLKAAYTATIPWEVEVRQFMTELGTRHYSMRKPRRRYISQGLYLPSLVQQRDKLANLAFYFDVSGSVTDRQAIRFLSEAKFVKERFNPEKMTIVLFDRKIQTEIVIDKHEKLDEIEIIGRGGTSLRCVREHIQRTKPTAAIVFSDLDCDPMEKLDVSIPIMWIVMDNLHAEIPFGRAVHIKE